MGLNQFGLGSNSCVVEFDCAAQGWTGPGELWTEPQGPFVDTFDAFNAAEVGWLNGGYSEGNAAAFTYIERQGERVGECSISSGSLKGQHGWIGIASVPGDQYLISMRSKFRVVTPSQNNYSGIWQLSIGGLPGDLPAFLTRRMFKQFSLTEWYRLTAGNSITTSTTTARDVWETVFMVLERVGDDIQITGCTANGVGIGPSPPYTIYTLPARGCQLNLWLDCTVTTGDFTNVEMLIDDFSYLKLT